MMTRWRLALLAVAFAVALFVTPAQAVDLRLGGGASTAPLSCDGTNCTIASGQVLFPDGTYAAPSVRRTADNRGFFWDPNPSVSSPSGLNIYDSATTVAARLGVSVNNAVQSGVNGQLVWVTGAHAGSGSIDTGFKRAIAGVVQPTDGTTGNGAYYTIAGTPARFTDGANGKFLNVQQITESHTLAAATTSDTTVTFPAGALVLAVSVRVTTTITASAGTNFTLGDATTAGRYSTASGSAVILFAAGTTHQQAPSTYVVYTAATAIRFTCGGGGSFTAGVVRVTGYYIDLTAPSS